MTHPDIESEVYRRKFLKNFKKLSDDPELGNLQFNFSTYGEHLARYMTSEDLPLPLTIGINGAWGSGKTTLIKTIQQNIDKTKNSTKQPDTIYFDFNAWAAEKTDVVVSLFQGISEFLCSEKYMAKHQKKQNANELWLYFKGVIDWVESTFIVKRPQMKGVDLGSLYNEYKDKLVDTDKIEKETKKLMENEYVENKKGIYHYIMLYYLISIHVW